MSAAPLVVGFDLDMTLIDTRKGFAACLTALSEESGVDLDAQDLASRLGPPLDRMLSETLDDPGLVASLVERFRALYPEIAVAGTPALVGAHEALAAVRRHNGTTVVVTGKHTPNARLHLDALEFDVDHLVGSAWGPEKGDFLAAHGATVFVGDHVHDVEGALAAGATSVSVLSGSSSEQQLLDAGTHVVLAHLADFPDWLDEHVLTRRLQALQTDLLNRRSLLVAFSGGADSAFLLAAAVRAVGTEHVAAATGYSSSLPARERDAGREFAERLGVRLLTPQTHEMARDGYRDNGPDRCFHCKAELVDVLAGVAREHGLKHVATGTNADDARAGFRPGIRAAGERGAITPLLDAGLTKAQVREASRRWGLPTWDKPAAACLASRVAYGVEVTPRRLARIERAESGVRARLSAAGIRTVDLRVRDLGGRARVELDADVVTAAARVPELAQSVRDAGFAEAEVEFAPFRSGSMNDLLPDAERHR